MTNASSIVRPIASRIAKPISGSGQGVEIPRATQVFILAGQSNMVGRATFDGLSNYPENVFQYTMSGEIINAMHPLEHPEGSTSTMGLALQFAIDFRASHPNVDLMLVPAAHGGTGFSDNQWGVGDPLYSSLVARANALFAANPAFQLAGILWHQGERDAGYASYQEKLDEMIAGLRSDIAVATDTTPVVLGELLPDLVEANANNEAVNDRIKDTPNRVLYTTVVSSFLPSRLTHSGDGTHFDAASLRLLGSRYFEAVPVARANAPTAPSMITSLTAGGEDQRIVLSWSEPMTGGMPITDYVVERSVDGASWSTLNDGVSAALGYTDSGLINGTPYHYRVSSVNSIGQSSVSASVSATPESADAAILSTNFVSTTADGTAHQFTGVDVGAGGTILVAAACRGSSGGISEIAIGGRTATLFDRNVLNGNYLRFGYVTGAPAGTLDIDLTHDTVQSRVGVHVWVLKGVDLGAAAVSNSTNTVAAIDAPAGGLVFGMGTSINPPSQAMIWSGLDERDAWVNYGDNFGSGSADRAFGSDAGGHAVSFSCDGNFQALSLVAAPKG